jgi:hypothetical protein
MHPKQARAIPAGISLAHNRESTPTNSLSTRHPAEPWTYDGLSSGTTFAMDERPVVFVVRTSPPGSALHDRQENELDHLGGWANRSQPRPETSDERPPHERATPAAGASEPAPAKPDAVTDRPAQESPEDRA